MTTKKPARRSTPSTRPSASRAPAQRTTTARTPRRTTTTRRTTTSRTTTRRATTRRRQPKLATTVGAALATLLVTTFTSMSWSARLAVIALVLVAGLAWVLWSHRAEIRAAAEEPTEVIPDDNGPMSLTDTAPTTPPTDPLQEPTP